MTTPHSTMPEDGAFSLDDRFLGQDPNGKRLFMRVCDWWRREGDLLVENWVFVDIPHVLLQMGVDLFEDIEQP